MKRLSEFIKLVLLFSFHYSAYRVIIPFSISGKEWSISSSFSHIARKGEGIAQNARVSLETPEHRSKRGRYRSKCESIARNSGASLEIPKYRPKCESIARNARVSLETPEYRSKPNNIAQYAKTSPEKELHHIMPILNALPLGIQLKSLIYFNKGNNMKHERMIKIIEKGILRR